MSFSIHQISYVHTDNKLLFRNIGLIVNKGEKASLIGVNGSGKSTLLRIIAGVEPPSEGEIICSSPPYYVPQHFGQYDSFTVAEALGISDKLQAFYAILNGDVSESVFSLLNDDWNIEERCKAALDYWDLGHIDFNQSFRTLSGGEKTKVFLAGLQIHQPGIILLDEPTNHLDTDNREKLYRFVQSCPATLLVVSHDITLLNQLPLTYELRKEGITTYGGNYDFYKQQKTLEIEALQSTLEEKEKELRLAKKTAREAAERKQKHEARGKKQNERKGVGKMAMNTFRDKAEKSASKLKDTHVAKTNEIQESIKDLYKSLPNDRTLKIDFNDSNLHTGKILIKADNINFSYSGDKEQMLFPTPVNLIIRSGDRLHIRGGNGSGKTTLLKLLTGKLLPSEGMLEKADFGYVYIDQEYTVIQNHLTVYEQAEAYNYRHFAEHEIKTILNRYLFTHDSWDKTCDKLSGGEKMRLCFCCLMIGNQTPDMIILDEPTNNLDMVSIETITSVIRSYAGTVICISHDSYFTKEIGMESVLSL